MISRTTFSSSQAGRNAPGTDGANAIDLAHPVGLGPMMSNTASPTARSSLVEGADMDSTIVCARAWRARRTNKQTNAAGAAARSSVARVAAYLDAN